MRVPLFVVEDIKHELAIQQSLGIAPERAIRWLHFCCIRNEVASPMPSRGSFSGHFNHQLPIPTASPQQSPSGIFHSAAFSLTILVENSVP